MKSTPADPRSPKEVWDEQHNLAVNDPTRWLRVAQSLIDAFEILAFRDEQQFAESSARMKPSTVPYMLAGFAIENLLKSHLVACGKHRDELGRFKLLTHDLRQLAHDAGYAVDDADSRLLEKIQEFTLWAARYPAPIDPDAMRPRPTPEGGFAPRTYGQLGADWGLVRDLFVRFSSPLQGTPSSPAA